MSESIYPCDAARDSRVHVSLGTRSYEILIVSRRLQEVASAIEGWMVRANILKGRRSALVVTDRHVADSHATVVMHSLNRHDWKCHLHSLPPGEPTKTLATASALYDQLVSMKADRQTCVIAVGGGVIGDAAGFAAATYNRGLPFIQIPTTLLAQVDSSVGGKVGINHPQGKNLIGAFHQPIGVFIDTTTLNTLPDRDFRSGLAEVVKYGVILDADFFEYLESHVDDILRRDETALRNIVSRSCRLKADVVEHDEYETTGLRAVLNYGHTFAHAYEALCGYGELTHGEAVSIGMVHASLLAEVLGRIPAAMTERQRDLLARLGLPVQLPAGMTPSVDDIIDRMRLDKKSVGGSLRFVLPTRMGHVETVRDIPEEVVRKVLMQVLSTSATS